MKKFSKILKKTALKSQFISMRYSNIILTCEKDLLVLDESGESSAKTDLPPRRDRRNAIGKSALFFDSSLAGI